MPAKLQEITAVYRWERHRFGLTTVIADCDRINGSEFLSLQSESLTIKVNAEVNELIPGLSYRFYGKFTKYKNKRSGITEEQFQAKTFVLCQPHGESGTIRYLMQAPHIGTATATRLWKVWKGDAVRILRESPDTVADRVDRLSREKAAQAAEFLTQQVELEGCTIDLMDLLDGRGFRKDMAKRAVRLWGNKAAEFIRRNPYLLTRFPGAGFLACDKMFEELGGNPLKMKRQALCIKYVLEQETNATGNTWHTTDVVKQGLRKYIGSAKVQPGKAAKLAIRAGLIVSRRDENKKLWFAISSNAANEQTVAGEARQALQRSHHWPAVADLNVSNHQREQLHTALQSPLAIFAGGPGTGKTYSAARLIGKLIDRHGEGHVAICAPTGKAAVRISEALEEYGVALRARTIHSLLGVDAANDGDGWGFKHGPGCPLEFRYIIVDESSMIDTDLMAAFLSACDVSTHVLLIGDTHQLPPVGHGRPLFDLRVAGAPTGTLTEIRRNAGSIVGACKSIRENQPIKTDETLRPDEGKNLKLIKANSGEAATERIVETLRKLQKNMDPIWDCQVICAVNKASDLSRVKLNKRLQGELNAKGAKASGSPFRVRDKIICLKNGYLPTIEADTDDPDCETNERDEVYVANGEIGRVMQVAEKSTVAAFTSPNRVIRIPRGKSKEKDDTGCSFDLAYAISCHKSQGSEFPVVLVALDDHFGARMVCSREWLYTAISRAKRMCLLFGEAKTAKSMCGRSALAKRKTFLVERIHESKELN